MNKLYSIVMLASVLLFSCSKENNDDTPAPLTADFTANVTGTSPHAQITITNASTGATSYEWTFSEGADVSSSTEKEPAALSVDKAGVFTITLVAKNGAKEVTSSKTITVGGQNGIATYSDIEFGLNANDATYGRLFSFEDGRIYKDSEINSSNGSKMHLAFSSMGNTMYYFESPSETDYNVPGATVTKVTNYQSTPSVTTAQFDAMTDDSLLSGLTIEETNESFGNSRIPGTVLFETATGRKGVIKTKAVNSQRLLVDIKIQKY